MLMFFQSFRPYKDRVSDVRKNVMKEDSVLYKTFSALNALLKKTYDKVLHYADHPRAVWILALISFMESSFFPIPPDILLIPMMLARPKRSFFYAGVCTAASLAGAFLGYAIGMFLYDAVAVPVFTFSHYMDTLEAFKNLYNTYGAWIVAGAGFTPFPYKVITITSGITGLDLGVFSVASVVSRGGRFFLLAFLLWKWGAPMEKFIEKNLGWLATAFFVLLVGGVALVKYM